MQTIAQNYAIVNAVPPQDINGVFTKSSSTNYISLKGYSKVTFLICGGSVADSSFTAQAYQSTVAAIGSASSNSINATALPLTHYWTNAADTTATTMVRTTASSSKITIASTNNAIYILEYDAKQLTQASSYDCIGLAFAANSTASTFVSVMAILHDARYAADAMPIDALL